MRPLLCHPALVLPPSPARLSILPSSLGSRHIASVPVGPGSNCQIGSPADAHYSGSLAHTPLSWVAFSVRAQSLPSRGTIHPCRPCTLPAPSSLHSFNNSCITPKKPSYPRLLTLQFHQLCMWAHGPISPRTPKWLLLSAVSSC